MMEHAKRMEFEEAAVLRDEIIKLKEERIWLCQKLANIKVGIISTTTI